MILLSGAPMLRDPVSSEMGADCRNFDPAGVAM